MTQNISSTNFEILLALLDADREQAGAKYQSLRLRLMKFFEWRNCENPEDLADVVFDRVLRKISESKPINNVAAFSATIAQFVFKEYLRSNERQYQLIEEAPEIRNLAVEEPDPEDELIERRRQCLEKCLAEFSTENQKFIIAYYATDERTLINSRKKLAEDLNASLNTIRIKACRLKAKLENCTLECCAGQTSDVVSPKSTIGSSTFDV